MKASKVFTWEGSEHFTALREKNSNRHGWERREFQSVQDSNLDISERWHSKSWRAGFNRILWVRLVEPGLISFCTAIQLQFVVFPHVLAWNTSCLRVLCPRVQSPVVFYTHAIHFQEGFVWVLVLFCFMSIWMNLQNALLLHSHRHTSIIYNLSYLEIMTLNGYIFWCFF